MRRAAAWLALVVVALGCGGDDDDPACTAVGGTFVATLGPGTGTCSALDLGEVSSLLASMGPIDVGSGDSCGERDLGTATADGGDCGLTLHLEGAVTGSSIVDGVASLSQACTNPADSCQHSFLVTFAPRPDAGPK